MSKRKISECINIRINVGNYQHIELVKYAEEEIEFSSVAERQQKEDQLRDDLVQSMIRSMKAIPEKLGKGIENAVEVEQSIKKAIPEWMEKGGVPNIANNAKKIEIKTAAEQKDTKDKATADSEQFEVKQSTNTNPANKAKGKDDDASDKELFEDKFENGKSKDLVEERTVAASTQATPAKTAATKKDSLFDDDDLFGEK